MLKKLYRPALWHQHVRNQVFLLLLNETAAKQALRVLVGRFYRPDFRPRVDFISTLIH